MHMPKLEMKDGSIKTLNYNQATKIRQVLLGETMPENEAQAEFCGNVKRVVFDNDRHMSFKLRLERFGRDHNLKMDKEPEDWTTPVSVGVFGLPVERRLPYKD